MKKWRDIKNRGDIVNRYILTRRTYNTMVGRGYKLVCRTCGFPLEVGDEVESKPSKYRRWKCEECGTVLREKPEKRKRINDYWYLQCPYCSGIVYCCGRKFYHADCYDGLHIKTKPLKKGDI